MSSHQYDYNALTAPISKTEIETALKQLKKDSASKIDDITTGLLLLNSKATVTWMKLLAVRIWKKGSVLID